MTLQRYLAVLASSQFDRVVCIDSVWSEECIAASSSTFVSERLSSRTAVVAGGAVFKSKWQGIVSLLRSRVPSPFATKVSAVRESARELQSTKVIA